MAKEKSLYLPGILILLFDLDFVRNLATVFGISDSTNSRSSSLSVFNSRSSRSSSGGGGGGGSSSSSSSSSGSFLYKCKKR